MTCMPTYKTWGKKKNKDLPYIAKKSSFLHCSEAVPRSQLVLQNLRISHTPTIALISTDIICAGYARENMVMLLTCNVMACSARVSWKRD